MSDMSDVSNANTVSGTDLEANMRDDAMQLDGNAAAGVLTEVFGFEMTGAQSTCAHCGQTAPLGGMLLYGGMMGTVLRCSSCEQVQMRIVRVPGRDGQVGQYWIDLRGINHLVITPATSA
jgi:propanediol dehydratase large subunit